MRSTRLRSSRSTLVPLILLIAALVFWPVLDGMQRQTTNAQSVSWLGPESTSYLTNSSGIPVWVPSWLPSQVAGVSPEIYAGGGSYSIYFYGAGGSFLYISGVAGAGFPGGSEANLNVELTVNSSVAGYPAIHDIGIPAGSETQIYDKIMWIAGGVLYTVSGNGLDSGSPALANSSVVLSAPAPAPTSPPVVQNPDPVTSGGSGQNTAPSGQNQSESGSSTSGQSQSTSTSSSGPVNESEESQQQPTGVADDGSAGAWYTGQGVSDLPSDGTAGASPPRINYGDGTGGAP